MSYVYYSINNTYIFLFYTKTMIRYLLFWIFSHLEYVSISFWTSTYNLKPFFYTMGDIHCVMNKKFWDKKAPRFYSVIIGKVAFSFWLQNHCDSSRDHILTCQSSVLEGLSFLISLWMKKSLPRRPMEGLPSHIVGQITPNTPIKPNCWQWEWSHNDCLRPIRMYSRNDVGMGHSFSHIEGSEHNWSSTNKKEWGNGGCVGN